MELIQRYIYSIKRRLLSSGREDIAKEINSLIMDELEGKFGSKEEYTKEQIEEVLLEMGHPREVAARYRGDKQYIIGPDVINMYKMVLGIAAAGTTLGLFISFVVSSFGVTGGAWEVTLEFLKLIPTVFSALLGVVGGVTIAFWLIDRFAKFDKKELDFNEGWKPKDLPELPLENERVRMWEPIVSITLTVIFAVFINSYASYGGVPFVETWGDNITILPIFNIVALKQILPLWNLSILAALILQLILLRKGKWQLGTRIFEIGLSLFSIVILVVLLNTPILISLEGITSLFGNEAIFAQQIQKYYYTALKVIIGLTSLGALVNTIKLIVHQAKKANV